MDRPLLKQLVRFYCYTRSTEKKPLSFGGARRLLRRTMLEDEVVLVILELLRKGGVGEGEWWSMMTGGCERKDNRRLWGFTCVSGQLPFTLPSNALRNYPPNIVWVIAAGYTDQDVMSRLPIT
jgi:hypothetical protein